MRVLSFLCSFFFLSAGAFATNAQIIFSEKIDLSAREMVTLYDVVEAQGLDLELLKKIPLSIQARPGETLDLTQASLLAEIREPLSQLGTQIEMKIPQKISLHFSRTALSQVEIERKIQNHLKLKCSDCRFQIRISKLPQYERKNWTLDFQSLKEKGAFLLPLDQEGFWISGMIRTQKPVLVAKKTIRRDEKVTSENVTVDYQDITFVQDYLESLTLAQDMKARRDLNPGTLLQTQSLMREPAAVRGQTVKVITGDDAFEVSTRAIAEAQGQVGDVIPLRLLDSKKLISGEIVEKGLVKVQ